MLVLVTGATGFLGAHVVRELLRRGHAVRALARPGRPAGVVELDGVELARGDMLDEPTLSAACRGAEGLVHCAARLARDARARAEQRRVNVEGTAALYRAAHKHRLRRIVHVSSVAAVGATRDGSVLDESAVWNLHPLRTSYVDTKRAGEERALAAARGGMPIVVVNPSSLFGRRLGGGDPPGIVRKLEAGAARWSPPGGISIAGVEEVAIALVSALESGRAGERYLLAGHNLDHCSLDEHFARALGVPPPRWRMPNALARALALSSRLLELPSSAPLRARAEVWRSYGWYAWFDSSKAVRELGYRTAPMEELLARTLARA